MGLHDLELTVTVREYPNATGTYTLRGHRTRRLSVPRRCRRGRLRAAAVERLFHALLHHVGQRVGKPEMLTSRRNPANCLARC